MNPDVAPATPFGNSISPLSLDDAPDLEIGVRSCKTTKRPLRSRAMARPLRVEFPGAV